MGRACHESRSQVQYCDLPALSMPNVDRVPFLHPCMRHCQASQPSLCVNMFCTNAVVCYSVSGPDCPFTSCAGLFCRPSLARIMNVWQHVLEILACRHVCVLGVQTSMRGPDLSWISCTSGGCVAGTFASFAPGVSSQKFFLNRPDKQHGSDFGQGAHATACHTLGFSTIRAREGSPKPKAPARTGPHESLNMSCALVKFVNSGFVKMWECKRLLLSQDLFRSRTCG